MPAISPIKLKLRSARLAEQYTQPGIFVREMHALLMFYADNTHRPGKSGSPSTLLDTYNTPPPVLRQIWLDLKPVAESDQAGSLALCDALWSQTYLEHRLLACMLLGQVSVSPPDPITDRLLTWTSSNPEEQFVKAIISQGMERLRRESPDTLLKIIKTWLTSPLISTQRLGMRALIPLVEDIHFHNLPAVFSLITPFLHNTPRTIRPDMVECLSILARRSPNELAYILKSMLNASDNADTSWLVRKVLPEFPSEIQPSLRQASRS